MTGSIEVFIGLVTDVEARVYAQFHGDEADPLDDSGNGVTLAGVLRGPFCEFARTLRAEILFRDLGPGPTPLAEAVMPDPCEWSVDLPHWYEAEVRAQSAGRVITEYSGIVGVRRWVTQGRNFLLAGRRWVIRAARRSSVEEADLEPWRDARMAMWAAEPSDDLCHSASRAGVLLLADLRGAGSEERNVGAAGGPLQERINRLVAWPAVALVILSPSDLAELDTKLPRSVLLAEYAGPSRSAGSPHERFSATIIEAGSEDEAFLDDARRQRPILVLRAGGPYQSPEEARGECDRLQRDLAGRFDPAGYIV